MNEKKKSSGKRNRAAGHAYELRVVKVFQKIYPHVRTSRSVSRTRDAQKVDLAHVDEHVNGRFPYNVQCKSVTGGVVYPKLLKQMPVEPGIMNVIFHKYTSKTEFKTGGSNFRTVGEFAICRAVDFMELIRHKEAYRILFNYYEFLPEIQQKEIQDKFIEKGLA